MIAAITVLFKPSESVYENIKTYLDYISSLYIVDNSPTTSNTLKKILGEKKVKLLSSSINIGLSKAYNLGLDRASQDGYSWLMVMDQDSFFDTLQIENFLEDFKKTKKNSLALYAPLHNSKFLSQSEDRSVSIVMSSASIVNVDTALTLGGFDNALFIDEVDHEFCMRIEQEGFIILQNHKTFVNHFLGKIGEDGRVKYSATRLYYMVRNHLYIKNRYQNIYPEYFETRVPYIRKMIITQIWYHKQKMRRTMMVLAGIKDYYLHKMGKRYEF
ncbi:MAG: glycosyltransferase [Campylobacterota bacterium]|nr:glycosyltransferase [Campylobacterota bacterium]